MCVGAGGMKKILEIIILLLLIAIVAYTAYDADSFITGFFVGGITYIITQILAETNK